MSMMKVIPSVKKMVIRYGEIALKKRNREMFLRKLNDNVKLALKPLGLASLHTPHGMSVATFTNPVLWTDASRHISRVFGVQYAAILHTCSPTQEGISTLLREIIPNESFASFAIRAKRVNKQFPMKSIEMLSHFGALVNQLTGAKVDLTTPEMTIKIEVDIDTARITTHRVNGPAGLPTGVSGKVGVLLSGGIDSPVAAWEMMGRGCEVVCVHFHSAPFTSAQSQEKVVDLASKLSYWQPEIKLAMVQFGEIQKELMGKVPDQYRVIMYRRLMMRITEALLVHDGIDALVTGDSLGQVASQTLSNLHAVEDAATLPVLRPLIAHDKDLITKYAKQIETFDISIQPHDDACQFLMPKQPATRSRISDLHAIERELNLAELIQRGVESATWNTIHPNW